MADDDVLHELLDRWEEAAERGERLTAEDLGRDHPRLVPELVRRIERLRVQRMLEPTGLGGGRGVGHVEERPPEPPGGRYHLREKLGGGGGGEVWRASDSELHRDVAIKWPSGDPSSLLAEAKTAAAIRHPNILTIHDVGRDGDGRPFVVTELMTGGTLAERIHSAAAGRPPVAKTLQWVGQIAAALQAVHHSGRVHRDVKPDNILLDGRDNAVLADFGIALEVASQTPGSTRGTRRYKSPEQLAGRRIDARSDIYGLALVAHEALAGELPFTNPDDAAAVEREIASGLATRVSRRVPAGLRPVVARGLAVVPDDRPESAVAFARDLERAWRWSTIGRWAAVAAVVPLLAVGLQAWRLRQEHGRAAAAAGVATGEAQKQVREVMRVRDDAMRKLDEVQDLGRRIMADIENDPFHRARRAENEARRAAEREAAGP